MGSWEFSRDCEAEKLSLNENLFSDEWSPPLRDASNVIIPTSTELDVTGFNKDFTKISISR